LEEANNIKAIDPTRALSLVDRAQLDLAEAKKIDEENEKITSLEERSSDLEAEITRTTKVNNVETVFDFSNIKSGANLTDIAINNGQIILIDSNQGVAFRLDSVTKSGDEISTPESTQTITAYPGGYYLTAANGVSKIDSSFKVTSVASNANWGKVVSAATFQNNLYLLDTEKNEIWRYLSTSSGLGSGRAYITGEKPNLASAVAIEIDGLVWVANKNGIVYKFGQGKKQDDFQIEGLADPIGELADMFTSPDTKNHYFLDKGKGRIVISDKTGIYQSSLATDQLQSANAILVDEAAKTVYFTSESKVYQFRLP
jgi:hypothetical protein